MAHPLPARTMTPPAEAVVPLIRGIAVLHALADAGGVLSLPDLEARTGLVRSTLDRVAGTLARMNQLHVDGRFLVLAPRVMQLGNAYLGALRLPELLGPLARDLARELDESVSLAVGDEDGIRFVHQTTRRRALSVSFRVGDLLPAEIAAPGPLVAAQWGKRDWERWRRRRSEDPCGLRFPALPPRKELAPPRDEEFAEWTQLARERGWALDDQLIEPGLVALSVPVRQPGGRLACVASLVSHTSRHSAADLRERLLPRLADAARAMEERLRAAPAVAPQQSYAGLASWTAASKQELGRRFVESLARGLTVLTAFGGGRESLTLTEVAQATGLARATARRALITLEHLGYVAVDGRSFTLTPRVLGLGYAPLSRLTLSQIAQPHLTALAERVQDSVSLAVLDGDDVHYTARVSARRILTVEITPGTRLPALATSMGRVLLADLPAGDRAARLGRAALAPLTAHTTTDPGRLAAHLDHAAAEGFALVDQELEEGLRSIAVPVRDLGNHAVAAVNVAMHIGRRGVEECVTQVLPELRAAVGAIEADLHVVGRFTNVAPT